jgi:hypothetical protein
MTIKTPFILVCSTAAAMLAMVSALFLLPITPVTSPKGFGIMFAMVIWLIALQIFNSSDSIKRASLSTADWIKFITISIVIGGSIGAVERMFNMHF